MSNGTQYFVSPMQPGVRPADPPDYDGITFVYLFTYVLDPWVVPAQLQNVVLVVDNAQGFLSGMSIIIEGAGSFQVVSTDALNRMTVQNLGYSQNAAPGTGIGPGKITTTSLPGPKGDTGIQGIPGAAATIAAGSTTTTPAGQNANVVNSGTPSAAIFDFSIPRGPTGPQGAQGAPGQAYNNVTTAAFTAANAPTVQTLSLGSTTGLFAGVTLNINPIGYYQVSAVLSGTQVSVVNAGIASNAAPGTVSPSGSTVLGTGPEGPPGNAATIAVGSTTTGAPGSNASVTNTGNQNAAVFNFTVPQGPTGAQGVQGPAGANGAAGIAATVAVGSTTTGAPGSSATVTNTGSPSAGVFNFTVPQGIAGAQGPQGAPGTAGSNGAPGAPGAAATVAAGTTSTGLPGTNASVTNSGSSSAAVFNFTIPRGDVGTQGPTGPQGNTGATGPQGPPSPSTPSANTGNLLTAGTDSLLYLPPSALDPEIWSVRLRSFNAIGNPTFEVDQKQCGGTAGISGASPLVGIDRWFPLKNGAVAMGGTWQQMSGTVLIPGTNFAISAKFYRCTLTVQQTTLAAGDSVVLLHYPEGPLWRELMSDVHSLAILVRSTVAGLSFGLLLRDPPTATKSLSKLCTIPTANAWTLVTLPNLPVWPSGNFANTPGSNGYQVLVSLACGSTNMSPANDTWQNGAFFGAVGQSNFGASPVNSTFDIGFIQHEPGPLCTTLIDKPFTQNLDECLRYFQKTYDYGAAAGSVNSSGEVNVVLTAGAQPWWHLPFKKPMAKAPTIAGYSPATGAANAVRDVSGAVDRTISSVFAVGQNGFGGFSASSTNAAVAQYNFHYTADTGW